MRSLRNLLLFVSVFVVHAAQALDAPPELIPADLSPGDQFYIVFAGSDTLDGAQSSAAYAAYAATVKANNLITDSIAGWTTLFGHDDSTLVTTSAFGSNTAQPVYNINGDRVADNMGNFFSDSQVNAVGYDESGVATSANIWTGFNFNGSSVGIGDDSLGGNDSLNDGCVAGNADQTNSQWAASVLVGGAGCAGVSLGLYVLSPLLTVPGALAVPVANHYALGVTALLLIALAGWARKRTSSSRRA